ncbi:MAG: class II aldolase/adducin family protein [Desulfitobacteriia bacterium]|jgi:L-ribulose-5-phosphate 4-epimerase
MSKETATLDTVLEDLISFSKKTYNRKLTSGIGGNLSARIFSHPDQIFIKASGKSLAEVEREDFIRLNLEGDVLEGRGRPSIETPFHCGIYKIRPEIGGILHGHSVFATAYGSSQSRWPTLPWAAEAGLHAVEIIEYAKPGSQELAQRVIKAFANRECQAVILQGHGFVTIGRDIGTAFYLADMLEDSAKTLCLMSILNKH